ncbi:Hypothetical protein LOCK908_2892 [Lacticaseibacillus rhamnosus LOCK908]|nr:Hypothetical protein LOCK908_2892 [Lacticaseibacillus rhamnosus LOCK908]
MDFARESDRHGYFKPRLYVIDLAKSIAAGAPKYIERAGNNRK